MCYLLKEGQEAEQTNEQEEGEKTSPGNRIFQKTLIMKALEQKCNCGGKKKPPKR